MKARVAQPNSPKVPARSDTRWHQVPLLWICLALFLLMMMGCVHLIVISLQFDDVHSASEQPVGNGAYFRMPLTKGAAAEKSPGAALAEPAIPPSTRKITERINASDSN